MIKRTRILFQRSVLCVLLLFMAAVYLWTENHLRLTEPAHFAQASNEWMEPAEYPSANGGPVADTVDEPENISPADDEAPSGISFWNQSTDIIGINDMIYQPETGPADAAASLVKEALTRADWEKLYDFDYLLHHFYLAETNTGLMQTDIDIGSFLDTKLSLASGVPGPKILIFHTHSTEMFADSRLREPTAETDPMEGVMGAGRYLAELLTNQYGIETLHHTGRYDIFNGKAQITGAYERMEPSIRRILAANPSIRLVIDLHRDGLREGVPPMVTEINGKPTARIMFVNGLSRTRKGEVHTPVPWLPNPYINENLMLSFQMQLHANQLYPGFARKVYLKPYRYSLHMLPLSLLVEVGAQNNTKQESLNAMEPLAEILAQVVNKH